MEQEYQILLTDNEKAELESIILQLPALDIRHIPNHSLTDLLVLGRKLPERIVRRMIEFSRAPNPFGALLIQNLPFDLQLPCTPGDGGFSAAKSSFISEYCLLLLMLFLGEPIAFEDEKDGLLIQNICPVKGRETRQENSGSNYFFKFHTEDAFHPFSPDYLALFCLRSDHDKKAKTLVASIIKALPSLPSTAIELLRQPLFQVHPPPSFQNDALTRVIPILSGSLLQPEMCVHFPTMAGVNNKADWALNKLQHALREQALEITLQPGEMLIVNNRIAAHARNAFQARYDGYDRWLQRMFVVESLRASSYSRGLNSPICSPLFVENDTND